MGFIANLFLNAMMKEFLKSANIFQSYERITSLTHSVFPRLCRYGCYHKLLSHILAVPGCDFTARDIDVLIQSMCNDLC